MPELVISLGVLLVVGVIAWHLADRVWARRLVVRRRVVVNLVGDRALRGVLWARRGRWLVLRGVELLEPGREPVAMDGDVVIDRGQVEFVQVAG